MTTTQMAITVLICVLGTVFTRFIPYIIFPEGRKVPAYVEYLGKVLGPAVFGILVVYCIRNTDFVTSFANGGTHGIPELASIAVTILVFRLRRQMVPAMIAGTALYMIFVQVVF
ncbi:MAG: branched-chain amino acid transporter permease [Bilifractor sp.]|jgi:branched-subunit amino acid transport protein AzlD